MRAPKSHIMTPTHKLILATVVVACFVSSFALPVSFNHGVAAGDPMPTRMVIWTRVTPRMNATTINVRYKVSSSKEFKGNNIVTGNVSTSGDRDYTVKADVTGLTSGARYYYQFYVSDNQLPESVAASSIGTFKTPFPAGNSKQRNLKYAVFSCSNWGWGYFNAYDAASKVADLDFWVHLGDWLYEYGVKSYPTPEQAVRFQEAPYGLQPGDEIVTLEQYRARHALYRQDPGLQALSGAAPLIAMWDDHEITNNARKVSAENHQAATEGDYLQRVNVSIRAYHEWMPTRDHGLMDGEYIGINYNRTYQFGDLATFIMTETRLTARSNEKLTTFRANVTSIVGDKNRDELTAADKAAIRKIAADSVTLANDPDYIMLGQPQLDWIEAETVASAAKTTWQLYGFGTVMLDSSKPDFEKAIADKKTSSPVMARVWEDAYRSIAYYNGSNTTTKSYGMGCHNLPYYGTSIPVTPAMRASVRTSQAIAEYKVSTSFDAWPGFQVEKRKFLSIAAKANNAASYGGDSHADWLGVQSLDGKAVLGEFDVGGVTSPSFENDAVLPLDLLAAAMVAGGNASGLRHAYAGKKGFFLVTLDKDLHHVDYIHATKCSIYYEATCDFAYDWFAKPSNRGDVVKSRCAFKPSKVASSYTSLSTYNTKFPYIGQQASFIP